MIRGTCLTNFRELMTELGADPDPVLAVPADRELELSQANAHGAEPMRSGRVAGAVRTSVRRGYGATFTFAL